VGGGFIIVVACHALALLDAGGRFFRHRKLGALLASASEDLVDQLLEGIRATIDCQAS
jgi:hypothetical protein